MNGALHFRIHQTIVALITIALLSLPFAHRAGAAPMTPEMTAYLALGGELSDICGDIGMQTAGGCESCNIAASLVIPQPADLAGRALFWRIIALVALEQPDVPHSIAFALPDARAPPFL